MRWFRRRNQLSVTLNMGTTAELHQRIDECGGQFTIRLLDAHGTHVATIAITRPESHGT